MELWIPTADELALSARALKTLALADGAIQDAERLVLDATLEVLGVGASLDALEPLDLAELRKGQALLHHEQLEQLLGGVLIVAMADGEVNDAETRLIDTFARSCGVEPATLSALRRLARSELRQARLDILRRRFTPAELRDLARHPERSPYLEAVSGMLNLEDAPEVTRRYRELERAPSGSLGRAYFDYVTRNDFPFPGERGAPPEAIVSHDLAHVLSGYDTDPRGEVLTASLAAGYSRYEVSSWFLFALAQLQLGMSHREPAGRTARAIDPRDLRAAAKRGAAMTLDPGAGWDYFAVMGEPVATLRERYHVLPHEAFLDG